MSIRKPILLITITATWDTIKEVFCEASALCANAMSSKAVEYSVTIVVTPQWGAGNKEVES